ncbi:MAG: glycosyltransferase family 4 protein [Acidobacteriales bacterium]|nr:glycosyltransferase family 4 protein [Terriglobales bacterium]
MRIGIDARFLTHPQCGGFKTYTECLVAALASVDAENRYILYVDRPPDEDAVVPRAENFEVRIVPGALPMIGMLLREQVRLPRQIARDRLDLFHSPVLTAPLCVDCPLVLTLYDMIWRFPEVYNDHRARPLRRRLMDAYYRDIPQRAARKAAIILAVSLASKSDIVRILGIAEKKVIVTHAAARGVFQPLRDRKQLEAVRTRFGLPSEFIMGICAADPRKNIDTLVKAYAMLPSDLRKQFPLVIMWGHDRLTGGLARRIVELGIDGQVLFRQLGPKAEEMAVLYNAASLFVFPSLYEGFGLPPLEAMACGTPVVAANNSSIPEVVGDAAVLVDARDAQNMASGIAEVLADETLRSKLSTRGLARAANFSWERCARETVTAYERIFNPGLSAGTKARPDALSH